MDASGQMPSEHGERKAGPTKGHPEPASDAGRDAGYGVKWLDDGAIFTIDRPSKLNALTKPILEGLSGCLDELEASASRLLVITGSGDRAFCAGTDLAEMQAMPLGERLTKSAMARSLFHRLTRSRIVSVAGINGLALGGGLELAMSCVLRIAAPNATFSVPEIKLGLLPAYGGTQLLPALVGRGRALELMLSGRTVRLDEALTMGLVHRVARDGSVEAAAVAFAREVTQFSAGAIEAIRCCVDAADPMMSTHGLAVEDEWVRSIFSGPEAVEGVASFLDRAKRAAR